MRLLFVVQRN